MAEDSRSAELYPQDLELKQDGRTLIKKGKMYRRSESSGFNDWNALHVVLFDNFREPRDTFDEAPLIDSLSCHHQGKEQRQQQHPIPDRQKGVHVP